MTKLDKEAKSGLITLIVIILSVILISLVLVIFTGKSIDYLFNQIVTFSTLSKDS
jgi:hypothetical protein